MAKMLNIFIGWDKKQPISYNVLQHSIVTHSSRPVAITPLNLSTLPITRTGLTDFTFSRYLVPWLRGYGAGSEPDLALFMDSDILVLGDIAELFEHAWDSMRNEAVWVVKNEKRFEWASVMLFNCAHPINRVLTPQWVEDPANNPFKFSWLPNGQDSDLIGELPAEWNHLVGYDAPRDDAKLVHYTMGIPPFEETNMCEYAEHWKAAHDGLNSTIPWIQLMGHSVHAAHLPDGRVLPHFHPEAVRANQEAAD